MLQTLPSHCNIFVPNVEAGLTESKKQHKDEKGHANPIEHCEHVCSTTQKHYCQHDLLLVHGHGLPGIQASHPLPHLLLFVLATILHMRLSELVAT